MLSWKSGDTRYRSKLLRPLFAPPDEGGLIVELVTAHAALTVFAVNQTLKGGTAASIIESFHSLCDETYFVDFEREDPDFREMYAEHSVRYFEILHRGVPFVEFPEAFLSHLDGRVENNFETRQIAFEVFDGFLNKTIDILQLADFGN